MTQAFNPVDEQHPEVFGGRNSCEYHPQAR
jgi:hypothetical protein